MQHQIQQQTATAGSGSSKANVEGQNAETALYVMYVRTDAGKFYYFINGKRTARHTFLNLWALAHRRESYVTRRKENRFQHFSCWRMLEADYNSLLH